MDISLPGKNIWQLPWNRVEYARMVSTRNMPSKGRNDNAGPNPMAMITKLQEELIELRKQSAENIEAIQVLKKRLGDEEEKEGGRPQTHSEMVE